MRRGLAALLLALAPLPAAAECPPVPEVARLAAAILDRRPPPPPRGDLSMADALCARDRLVAALAQPWGDPPGWKVAPGGPGGTPLAGALFFGTLRASSGAELPARFGIVPMLAPGLLLRIGADGIERAGDDHVALLRHVEAVSPFLDLPDLVHGPGAPWSPALRLSLNLGTRLGVVGEPMAAPATRDFARRLGSVQVALADGTGPLVQGRGDGGPGHPLDALAWLVRQLAAEGRVLRAGEVVAITGLAPPVPAVPGDFAATFTGLGPQPARVELRLR